MTPKRTVDFARRLRRVMTPPEMRLWAALRRRQAGGLRFRRQHPLGRYVLDFYCVEAKLAVEVDGVDHGLGERPRADAIRDAWLLERGVETLRVYASDVRDNLDGVWTEIVMRASGRLKEPPLSPAVTFPP